MSEGDYSDRNLLLRSNSSASDGDLEVQGSPKNNKGFQDLLKRLDQGFSGRRLSIKRSDRDNSSSSNHGNSGGVNGSDEILSESAPPEWVLLLISYFLGLATGLCVAAFNRGVSRYSWVMKWG